MTLETHRETRSLRPLRVGAQRCAIFAVILALAACEPKVVVGDWACPQLVGEIETKTVESPWFTGFENGFCEYALVGGICYPPDTYDIVETPRRSGTAAAAFTITADPAEKGGQSRCYREGAFPEDALYGAWYFIPGEVESAGNWNLFHFQTGSELEGTWDVSIEKLSDGYQLYVRDFMETMGGIVRPIEVPRRVPIGEWFHIQLRIVRAVDATGMVELYQDGERLLRLTDITTTKGTNAELAQWYVGNLAYELTPMESTLYVDDVSITPPP